MKTDRTKRVKEARAEAQKEIDEYRNQKEEEFKSFEKEVRSSGEALSRAALTRTTALQRQQENGG